MAESPNPEDIRKALEQAKREQEEKERRDLELFQAGASNIQKGQQLARTPPQKPIQPQQEVIEPEIEKYPTNDSDEEEGFQTVRRNSPALPSTPIVPTSTSSESSSHTSTSDDKQSPHLVLASGLSTIDTLITRISQISKTPIRTGDNNPRRNLSAKMTDAAGTSQSQQQPLNVAPATRCQPRTFSNDHSKGESWLVFRVHFNHVAKLNDWTPRQARFYLASSMVGDAGHAVLHIPTEVADPAVDTLESLLDKYQEIFLPPAQSETARLQFDMMNQSANESILHYASKMRCLYLHAYSDKESETSLILIRKFMQGLRNKYVRYEVMKAQPKTFSSAIATAMNNTSLREAQSLLDGAGSLTPGVYELQMEKGVPVPVGLHEIQQAQRNASTMIGNGLAQVQCYQCGNNGHFARNCNSARRMNNRGRGRATRRPTGRRPFNRRPIPGRTNYNGNNMGNRSYNVSRTGGSINAIESSRPEEVKERVKELQEQLAALDVTDSTTDETWEELCTSHYGF